MGAWTRSSVYEIALRRLRARWRRVCGVTLRGFQRLPLGFAGIWGSVVVATVAVEATAAAQSPRPRGPV